MKKWMIGAAMMAAVLFSALATQRVRADARDFTLINGHPTEVIYNVYVSPSDQSAWGDDVLGANVLSPGESVFIYFTGAEGGTCVFDILVRYQSGAEDVRYGLNLCNLESVTIP